MNTNGIIGHKKQIKNLENILKNDRIPHTILFSGTPGIGKKTIAKRFIKSLFCRDTNPPCLECPTCKQIENQSYPDYLEIATNEKGIIPIGSEEKWEPGSIRWLNNKLRLRSVSGKFGVIIDGAGNITEEGQNALLKTIEEPTDSTYFILISGERSKILPTIQSRCMEVSFNPLIDKEIKEIFVQEGREEPDDLIVRISGGSLEIAGILQGSDTLEKIQGICEQLSGYYKKGFIFDVDFMGINKTTVRTDQLLDIIINIYRLSLIISLNNEKEIPPFLKNIHLEDTQYILNILKILLALKKGLTQNINIKYATKGMLYHEKTGTRQVPVLNL